MVDTVIDVPNALPDALPSPNIWRFPGVYEAENRALDPDGRLWAAMWGLHPWTAATVLDIGCGSGFYLPRFAESAGRVVGVEPHRGLARIAARRSTQVNNAGVRLGSAARLPVPDASVDVVHARWAYFFGPGCEAGLTELCRVMRRGGTAFVIDNDATRSTFGRWFATAFPRRDPRVLERFWSRHGFTRKPVDMDWRFTDRATLEAVVRIEFAPEFADRFLAEHDGLEVDYAVNLWWRHY